MDGFQSAQPKQSRSSGRGVASASLISPGARSVTARGLSSNFCRFPHSARVFYNTHQVERTADWLRGSAVRRGEASCQLSHVNGVPSSLCKPDPHAACWLKDEHQGWAFIRGRHRCVDSEAYLLELTRSVSRCRDPVSVSSEE